MLVRESDDLSSLSEITSDELLPPISLWTVICGLSLISVVGIAFTLAAIIKYPVKIIANGEVRPVEETRLVQAPADATVRSINVKENQSIRQGDVIATLDDSPLQIKESQLTGSIQSSTIQLERINGQIHALSNQRRAEEYQMNAEIEEAQANLNLAQTTHRRHQQLANQGAISLQQRDESQQAYQSALAKVEQIRARGQSILAGLDKEEKNLLQRKDELQNQINRDRNDLRQIEADIEKYTIRSPVTGSLFKLDLRNHGQVVRSAETIAQVVPGNVALVIKAQIGDQDIGKIAKGQTVYLRVHAYPYTDYGILTGRVSDIPPDVTQSSANSIEQMGKPQAPSTYYEVTIEPDILYLRNDSKNEIKPGLKVTAEIIAREETVLTFLLRKAKLLTDF